MIRYILAAIMGAIGRARPAIIASFADEIELIAPLRPHLDFPQSPLCIESEADGVYEQPISRHERLGPWAGVHADNGTRAARSTILMALLAMVGILGLVTASADARPSTGRRSARSTGARTTAWAGPAR